MAPPRRFTSFKGIQGRHQELESWRSRSPEGACLQGGAGLQEELSPGGAVSRGHEAVLLLLSAHIMLLPISNGADGSPSQTPPSSWQRKAEGCQKQSDRRLETAKGSESVHV